MVRRAVKPLDAKAVAAADAAFHAAHPELGGKPLSATDPKQGGLRKEWMDLYIANGGKVEEVPNPPPNSPTQPCPGKGKPCANKGLANPGNIEEFAKDMQKLKEDWSTLSEADRRTRLETALNKQLKKSGTPTVTIDPSPDHSPGSAVYQFRNSAMKVSEKDLAASEMPADMADTVYHEGRHGEQWYLMARKMAADLKAKNPAMTPDEISKQIRDDTNPPIHKSITDAAGKNPITPGSPYYACAEAMADAVYGSGSDHRNKTLTDLSTKGAMMNSLNADTEKMNKAVDVLNDPSASPAAKAQARADRDAAEAHRKQTLKDNGHATVDEAYESYQKTRKDYKELPEEADAWATAEAAQKAFEKQSAKAAKK